MAAASSEGLPVKVIFIAGLAVVLLASSAYAEMPQLVGHPGLRAHAAAAAETSNRSSAAVKLAQTAGRPSHPVNAQSTPESRSAAALALSADPVFDEGTYQRIKETLLGYAAIQVRGGWPTIPADAKLAPGASGPEVALLRKRLVISDDLAPELEAGDSYDAALVDAVKHFQLRHGLEANGSIGPQTLRALNVPVAARIKPNVAFDAEHTVRSIHVVVAALKAYRVTAGAGRKIISPS
jgi:L,D-transpeptidase YcbB